MGTFFPHAVSSIFHLSPTKHTHTHTHTHTLCTQFLHFARIKTLGPMSHWHTLLSTTPVHAPTSNTAHVPKQFQKNIASVQHCLQKSAVFTEHSISVFDHLPDKWSSACSSTAMGPPTDVLVGHSVQNELWASVCQWHKYFDLLSDVVEESLDLLCPLCLSNFCDQ